MTKKSIVLQNWHGHYVLRDSQFTNENNHLTMIADALCDGGMGPSYWIRGELLDPESRGVTGNATDITIKENQVFIQPLYGEDPLQYRIEIDRQTLLKVIDDWEEIVKKKPDEIIMSQDEKGIIAFEGIFNKNNYQ